LRTYTGQGPLKAWVTVIAVRRLLALRSASHESLGSAVEAGASGPEQLELELLRARYAGAFKVALQRALDSLERRQRLVLRMHTVDGLSAEKIGAIFHAHRATASQWLADARAELRTRVALEVRREAGLESAELQSIARMLQRHTDFSLPRLLAAAPEAAP
jgi:RNA polymerase sigma-70 factor